LEIRVREKKKKRAQLGDQHERKKKGDGRTGRRGIIHLKKNCQRKKGSPKKARHIKRKGVFWRTQKDMRTEKNNKRTKPKRIKEIIEFKRKKKLKLHSKGPPGGTATH